jgi:hypothetical protein
LVEVRSNEVVVLNVDYYDVIGYTRRVVALKKKPRLVAEDDAFRQVAQ